MGSVATVRWACVAGLVAFLIYFVAEVAGPGNKSFTDFIATVWGRVVLVDLAVGLVIVAGWIAFRERSVARTLGWAASLLILGNAGTLLYLLHATRGQSGTMNWTKFFLGRRLENEST